ncbi:class II aldolase/adducin family protein [Gordonia sp. i37]|uniref:class II aldolase/adducin family protein n=1 Tax=Gordonia sp. i37 TaxID=1961707 RepID=UPI0009AED560|nr:class II aldolase/adducin family protein [Gordonia sp. i37]OPX12996.1 class II aldolase [Gordonia sp. i37]
MTVDTTVLRERVAAMSRHLGERGLFIGTAGNVSARVDGVVAITASGIDLTSADADEVTVVDLDGAVLDGHLSPSSEVDLHLGVYRQPQFAGLSGGVHTHSRFATALSIVCTELPVIHYQQLSLGGSLRVAPFETFGTPELATAVHSALSGRLAALMANHGAVALGNDLAAAADNALLLEWLCEIYWRAHAIGAPRTLNESQQHGVIEHALRIGYGGTKEIG